MVKLTEILNAAAAATVPQALSVERVQHRMSRPVRHGAAPVRLATLAVLVRLPAERALVDLALGRAGEGHAVVLQLDDGGRGLFRHVVDGVLF